MPRTSRTTIARSPMSRNDFAGSRRSRRADLAVFARFSRKGRDTETICKDLQDRDCPIAHLAPMNSSGSRRRGRMGHNPGSSVRGGVFGALDAWAKPFFRFLRCPRGGTLHFEVLVGVRACSCGVIPRLRLRAHRRRSQLADNACQLRLGRKLCMADILRPKQPSGAARRVPAAGSLHGGAFRQVRQRANAAFDILLRAIRYPRHERGRRARQPRLARLHPVVADRSALLFATMVRSRRANSHRRDRARNPLER